MQLNLELLSYFYFFQEIVSQSVVRSDDVVIIVDESPEHRAKNRSWKNEENSNAEKQNNHSLVNILSFLSGHSHNKLLTFQTYAQRDCQFFMRFQQPVAGSSGPGYSMLHFDANKKIN